MEKSDSIKVYRVLPDIFTKTDISHTHHTFESLYYYMGFTPFCGRMKFYPYVNNIQQMQREEGKFYFLFPEEALVCSSTLIFGETFKIVEYVFPMNVATNIIGSGEYENDAIGFLLANEIIVGRSYFTGNRLSSIVVDTNEKLQASINSISDTYKTLGKNPISYEELVDMLSQNRHYKGFLSNDIALVNSEEITNNIVTIKNEGLHCSNKTSINIDLLESSGISLDYSKDAQDARREVNNLVHKGIMDDARSLIRSLKSHR